MKIILIILGIATAVPALCQIEPRLVEISKEWVTKKITVTDGLIYKYTLPTDSARYFFAGVDEYDVTVTFKKKGTGPVETPTETIIDGVKTNLANDYTGTWVHSTSSWTSVFGGTASYSNTPGSTLTISFTGNRIQWFSEKSNNKGEAMVSIDGGTEISVPLFATNPTPPNVKSMVFESSELSQGPHTFKIRVVTASVLHDEVKVFSK